MRSPPTLPSTHSLDRSHSELSVPNLPNPQRLLLKNLVPLVLRLLLSCPCAVLRSCPPLVMAGAGEGGISIPILNRHKRESGAAARRDSAELWAVHHCRRAVQAVRAGGGVEVPRSL